MMFFPSLENESVQGFAFNSPTEVQMALVADFSRRRCCFWAEVPILENANRRSIPRKRRATGKATNIQ